MISCLSLFLEAQLSTSTNWLDYIKTLLILCAISILALLMARVVIPKLRRTARSSSSVIQIVARSGLEPGKTLYVVKAGTTMLLLASSRDSVQFMTALEPDALEGLVSTQPAGGLETTASAKTSLFQVVLRTFRQQESTDPR